MEVTACLAEKVFWNFLKCNFHISNTARKKQELSFYRKGDFQAVVDRNFRDLLKTNRLKTLKRDQVERILKEAKIAPILARCRFLPKKTVSSTRMITRKAKNMEKAETDNDLRLVLKYATKKFYSNMVDVKGKMLICCRHRRLHSVRVAHRAIPRKDLVSNPGGD